MPTTVLETTKAAAVTALQKAQAALDERYRLIAFGRDLAAQVATAAQAEATETAVRAHADAKSVLDTPAAKAGWLKQSEEAAKKITSAQQEQQRLRGAQSHIPAMLQAADDKILPACEAAHETIALFRQSARQAFEAQLSEAAKQLAEVIKCGFALAAGGLALEWTLNRVQVPSAVSETFLISGAYAHPGAGETVKLNEVWRDDPQASALFDTQRQFTNGMALFAEDVERIKRYRQLLNAGSAEPPKTGLTIERVSQPVSSVQGPDYFGKSPAVAPQGPVYKNHHVGVSQSE